MPEFYLNDINAPIGCQFISLIFNTENSTLFLFFSSDLLSTSYVCGEGYRRLGHFSWPWPSSFHLIFPLLVLLPIDIGPNSIEKQTAATTNCPH